MFVIVATNNKNSFLCFFRFYLLDGLRRDTAHYRVGCHVFRHDRPGRHDCIVADGHALQDSRVRADPHIPAQHYRGRVSVFTVFG